MKVGSDLVSRILTGDELETLGKPQKTEKHEIQMLIRGGGLTADENWMSAETS